MVTYIYIYPKIFQGPRGNDGDPGPQGVVGAPVSFIDIVIFY